MTPLHPHPLALTTAYAGDRLRMGIRGDLDHGSADVLLEAVTAQLAARPGLSHLHLDCGGLGTTDSMGLSVLLMIHRRTTAGGVRLHLDERPAGLDRILRITGTFEHLTGAPPTAATEPPKIYGTARTARPAGPDGTT